MSSRSQTLGDRDPRNRRNGQAWLSLQQQDERTIEKVDGRLRTKIHPDSRAFLVETKDGIHVDIQAISDAIDALPP